MDNCPPEPEDQPAAPPAEPASESLINGDATEVDRQANSPFKPWSTILWTTALIVGGAWVLFSITNARESLIERPEAYVDRVVGRDLDTAEYAARMSLVERVANLWDVSSPADALRDGIEVYQKYKADRVFQDLPRVQRTLAILLGEAGRVKEAEEELSDLKEDQQSSQFRATFRAAYDSSPGRNSPEGSIATVESVTPEWARDKLAVRLAEKRSDHSAARRTETVLLRRGERIQHRATVVSVLNGMLIAGGLAMLGRWAWRRGPIDLGHGNPASLWTISMGYAVLVRGAVCGMILAGVFAYLTDYISWASGFATLLSAAPLLLLTRKYLIRPGDQSFPDSFGLVLTPGAGAKLLGFTLAVAALMILGETVLTELTSRWQEASLPESIPEEFLFDPWREVLLSAADAVVWAPLVEEFAFRGVLYATLRRRLPIWAAALASSVIFGVVHGYSMQGLLIICWSGFLWALAYEKSRSLWPGILCHAISNLFAVASPILVYRL